jgi:flavin-dependent dehydrogenase
MYDVIVVGARCAGAPTAMLLARQGRRVLLVDRAHFPSDTISTHGITHRGLRLLQAWGLYQRILASNCPEVLRCTNDYGGDALSGAFYKADGVAALVCPRRTVLDKILIDASVEAGVELRQGFSVQDLVMENGCISGIRGRSGRGAVVTEYARVVVGADGRHSQVARAVQAPSYKEVPPLMCWYYSYWSNLQEEPARLGIYIDNQQRRKMLIIPTNDGLTCILVGWPHSEFSQVRANIEQEYLKVIQMIAPAIAERLHDSDRVERFYGIADLPNFFRKPYGPGWALVGDAGYHKDPVAAHGIADAFRDADFLAHAIHAGLNGEMPMMMALAEYERRRNEDAFPRYEQNCVAASFTPIPAREAALRAALHHVDQVDIDTYLSVKIGTASSEAFYAPANLERIFGAAAERTRTPGP